MSDNGQLITKDTFDELEDNDLGGGGLAFLTFMAAAGDFIPAWWSTARDIELRRFWKNSDHLSGTVNTLREMLVSMPVKVVARDNSIKSHVRQAQDYNNRLQNMSESRSNFVGQGWANCFGPFIEDFFTQDNGGFLAIDGPGRGDQPLQGEPTKLIHLDAGQCWRTQSPEHPIAYTDLSGKQYRLHKSRIVSLTAQSTPIGDMYGVGFCAVSRCINIAQNLTDIGRYKQEKLGSRPHRGMITISGGAGHEREAGIVKQALRMSDEAMDNQGLTKYSLLPVVSIKGDISLLDLASLPDGFNELESVQLGMGVLALAFGVDVRQLAFAIGVSGQTKADAEVQHLKMKGKTPNFVRQEIKQQLEAKFLPAHLKLIFDYQDDEADKFNAEIRKARSDRRKQDIDSGVSDIRTEREIMLAESELTEAQFVALELEDGRLPDGEDVLALFQSPDYADVLPPMDAPPEQIDEAVATMNQILMTNAPAGIKQQASFALAALKKLKAGQQEQQTEQAEESKLTLNASQVTALRDTLAEVQAGEVSEDNAIDIITSLGIPRETAQLMVSRVTGGASAQEVLQDENVEEEVQKENRKLGWVQFDLPRSIANKVRIMGSQIESDDLYELENNPHITIKYGLRDDRTEPIERINFSAFDIKIGPITLFQNDNFDVVKLDVTGDGLHELNKIISDNVDIEPSAYLSYNPHITIGYVKSGLGPRYIGLDNPLEGKVLEINNLSIMHKNGNKTIIKLKK